MGIAPGFLREVFVVVTIQTVFEHAKRQGLGLCNGFLTCGAVTENAGQIGHFADPSPIVFAFDINVEFAHCANY